MNNLDFEKTQIWAKNLINAPIPPVAAPPIPQAPGITLPQPKKPVMKKLSKEEKIILASGGALAIGLGAIVISSLSDEQMEKLPAPTADLTAPKLNLGVVPPPEPLEVHEEAPAPKPQHHAPAQHNAPKKDTPPPPVEKPHEEHHALLEIPETPEVATTVDDKQTFIDAFNTARAEIGPAGLFAWRDTYYSTFTDREWELVPEDEKEQWLLAAEPIIDPGYENLSEGVPEVPVDVSHVVVAERGAITWTGIDKNGDGQAEILMARIHGQSPMVLMDTDGDGILDKRYDYEAATGKTFASEIEPFSMSTADIEHLEYIPVEQDMGFFNNSGNELASEALPVSIYQENNQYVVSLDSNMDNTVDAITYLTDDRGPVVGLDDDGDGQIEMGYVYDTESQTISSTEMEPMEEMSLGETENVSISYAADEADQGGYAMEVEDELADNDQDVDDNDSDSYFNSHHHHSDPSDDYVNS